MCLDLMKGTSHISTLIKRPKKDKSTAKPREAEKIKPDRV